MTSDAHRRLLLNLAALLPPVVREEPFDVLVYTRWKWHRGVKTGAVKPVLKVRVDQLPPDKVKWITSKGCLPKDGEHILEWTKDYGKGRVYYTALGDNASDFAKPEFLEHLYRAAVWAARLQ